MMSEEIIKFSNFVVTGLGVSKNVCVTKVSTDVRYINIWLQSDSYNLEFSRSFPSHLLKN